MTLLLAVSFGTVGNAVAQCTVDLFANQNPSTCSSQVALAATASEQVQSWAYFIEGEEVGTSSTVLVDLTPGEYTATVIVITDQNCTAIDDLVFTVNGNPLEVDAGADITVCQEQTLLNATVSSLNPYTIQWTPSNLLENATTATPLVIQNVTNQWFTVDVVDDVTGCISSDTVYVTQQNPVFDSLSLCNGFATIDLGPGADIYDWLSWTDTAGNNFQLNVPQTQQTLNVNDPGQYFAVAYFPECGALTSLITVEACSQCTNFFTYNSQPQQCGVFYEFVPGASSQIVSYHWDFGDGTTSTDLQPTHIFTPGETGTYTVTLTTTDVDGCTSVSTEQIAATIGHSVVMSNDTIGCQEEAYMEAFPLGGSGDFSYEWFPSEGLTDPASAVTYASGVHNQTFICEVTDNVTGCTVGGEVIVSSYVAYFDTLYLCGDSVELDLGPGGDFYNWVPYYSDDYETQSIWVDQPGDYFVYATFPACGALTSNFTVEECPSTCTSSIFNNGITYQNCQTLINLGASYSSPIDSAIWDLGNGTTLYDDGSGIPTQIYDGGNYIVQLTAYHTGGCVSTTAYSLTFLTDITVEITADDTIACAGQLFLNVTASGGGGQYTYYWPLSGGTTPNDVAVVTQNQWVVVEVYDAFTGCSASDSVFVYANQEINETVEMCQSSVPLMVDPGSMMYSWTFTDPSGTIVSLPNQTNELEAFNLGTFTCMTYYSGCLQVEHTFEVVQCGTVCSSEFIAVPNPLQCGSLYDFAAQNLSQPVDSVVWDYGDGTTHVDGGGGEAHIFGTGTFTINVTAYHVTGCVSTSSQTITVNNGVSVELFEDSIACNGTFLPTYNIIGGSGNYGYSWEPASIMIDPTAAQPQAAITTDTWIRLTLTDTQQGCASTDSIFVYANLPINEAIDLCADSVLLSVNPGSEIYQWSFIDEFGNTEQIQIFDHQVYASELGQYICLSYYQGCNTITHSFVVAECQQAGDEVWPGDANADNIVTNTDALYLGLAFNQTGPIRPAATLNWVGQPCPDWTFNFAQNNENLKHADCDGNGIINFDDTLAIDFNYLNTHNKFEAAPAGGNPLLWIEATPDTVGLEQAIDITVHLATADLPVDSLHGVAFSLTFDETVLSASGSSVHFENGVLGTPGLDVLTFQKILFSDGAIDLAITRNTLENFNGYGPIAHARIVTTDNLSGMHDLPIGISNVFAITASEHEVALSVRPDTVVIDPNKVGIEEGQLRNVLIYPNPATSVVNISGLTGNGVASVLNTMGQEVMATTFRYLDRMALNLSQLADGVYLIQIRTESGITTRKLRLIRS